MALSPFGRWIERMQRRIRREEVRAELGEARANARKWSKVKPPRKGRSRRQRQSSSDPLAARRKPA